MKYVGVLFIIIDYTTSTITCLSEDCIKPSLTPTISPTKTNIRQEEETSSNIDWLWGIPAVIVPTLIIAIVTKPNILRDWCRILTCQHRNPVNEEE